MELVQQFVSFFLHLDEHLKILIQQYGGWTYLILFLIIFCETGLVVTPFLPGDSLLFAAGALAAFDTSGTLNIFVLWALLTVAAVLGDTVNYTLGHYFGSYAFSGKIPFLKKSYLERTEHFYAKYGGKTIILARFVPIVRTFAPFVAGVGSMHYTRFLSYNVIGGILWVTLFVFAGYLFGGIPFIQRNFELVAVAIVLISILPMVYEYLKARRRPAAESETAPTVH